MTTQPLNITVPPLPLWRCRNGQKARIAAIDAKDKYSIRGYVQDKDGDWVANSWPPNGRSSSEHEYPLDLIEPWTDKPEVNWAAMPAWAKWVAMEAQGDWYWYNQEPANANYQWLIKGRRSGSIPKEFAPTFTGDWRNSLVERPTEEGK